MTEVQDAWKEVGDKFSQLGYRFRDHYRSLEEERAATEPAEGADVEADEEAKKAFARLSEEIDTAFSSVGNAFRDTEVKEDTKAAAHALVSALGATFNEVGDALQRAFGGRRDTEPPAGPEPAPAPEPPPADEGGEDPGPPPAES